MKVYTAIEKAVCRDVQIYLDYAYSDTEVLQAFDAFKFHRDYADDQPIDIAELAALVDAYYSPVEWE